MNAKKKAELIIKQDNLDYVHEVAQAYLNLLKDYEKIKYRNGELAAGLEIEHAARRIKASHE